MNLTTISNDTTGSQPSKLNLTHAVALTQLTIIMLLGTVGNLLVIYVFGWKKRKNRKIFELLLLILGITDCFASSIVPSLFIYGTLTQFQQWHFGYYGCKIIHSIFPMTVTISQGILVLISYERCRVITDPFCDKMTKKFVYTWLFSLLITSVVIVSPYTYSLQLVVDRTYHIDTCVPVSKDYLLLFIFSVSNCSRDAAAMFVLVMFGVSSHKALIKGSLILGKADQVKKRFQNAAKTRKMLIIVTSTFCICVIPLDTFQLIIYTLFRTRMYLSKTNYQAILIVNTFLNILQITNSATNIAVYSKMHQDFTKNLFSFASRSQSFLRESVLRFSTATSTQNNFYRVPLELNKNRKNLLSP